MNLLIQKLAREAALAEGWGPGVWQTTFTEKFAELIVRECLEIAIEEERHAPFEGPVETKIRQHFGVEE